MIARTYQNSICVLITFCSMTMSEIHSQITEYADLIHEFRRGAFDILPAPWLNQVIYAFEYEDDALIFMLKIGGKRYYA